MKTTISEEINATIKKAEQYNKEFDTNEISDWYHTFWELYAHRIILWIKLCMMIANNSTQLWGLNPVWMSELHSDWSKYDGWFILWLWQDNGSQITYHIPMSYYEEAKKIAVMLENAPEYDWHTPWDVIERIKKL